jgi:Ca2+-binding RTX toxin-like protein
MAGGVGNDSYFVDNPSDIVNEAIGAGTDTVFASISFSLEAAQNVENLTLQSAGSTGIGNTLSNTIRTTSGAGGTILGMDGADSLVGGVGIDVLDGGAGVDTLTGGLGADIFMFVRGESPGDKITDFVRGTDHLDFYGYASAVHMDFAGVNGTLATWRITDGALTEDIYLAGSVTTLAATYYAFH